MSPIEQDRQVHRYAVEGYLQAQKGLSESQSKSAAGMIWTTLVEHSASAAGPKELPVRVYCVLCGLEYGKCSDNVVYNGRHSRYKNTQLNNWVLELWSLLECPPLLRTHEFFYLGKPNSKRASRQYLLDWLDFLESSLI